MKRSTPLLFLVFSLAIGSFANAQEWSRFRGHNGSGVAESSGLPTAFGPEENVRWHVEVPHGRSSPVLTQDAVLVTGASDESLVVLCLDRASGSVRWKRELERARKQEVFPANDSASPSPATDGENVYAFFPELGLLSLDGEGEVRWVHPLGPFVNFYGMAASPILAGDAVVLLCDQQQGSFLVAVDAATGEERWRRKREGMIESWTTPVLYPSAEKPEQIVVFGSFFVCGYDVGTGEEAWRMKGVGYTPICSPIVEEGLIFASVPYHAEQPLPDFATLTAGFDKNADEKLVIEELEGSELAEHFGWGDMNKDGFIDGEEWAFVNAGMSSRDFGMVAISLEEGTANEMWRQKKSLPSVASPILYEGVLYLVKEGGIVSALDPASGEVVKRERLPEAPGEYWASPVAGDGKLYFANDSGQVAVVEAGAEWSVLAVNDLGETIHATPALGRDELFVRTDQALFCFADAAHE